MELIIRNIILITAVSVFFTVGCNGYEKVSDREKMYDVASVLKDIATNVDGLIKYGNGKYLEESELILEAVNNDQSRLKIFDGFELHVKIEGNDSSLLLCKEGDAILEDTGCTAESDLHHWRANYLPACDFTIDLSAVCQ